MKLEMYACLDEKNKVFAANGYKKIDTSSEFKSWVGHFTKKKRMFRGVNEAKYKIYTSAQRLFITNDLQSTGLNIKDLIQSELNEIKKANNGLLKKFFGRLGVFDCDLLYLSFLQHYNGISPLIDFTTNFNTALFFMQDGTSFPKAGGNDIDNYMSFYYMDSDEAASSKPAKIEPKKIREITSFKTMSGTKEPISLGSQQYSFETVNVHLANLNIIAQDGRFVFYCNDSNPMESDVACVDIHKSVLPHIREYLEKNAVDKSLIYPQEETLCQKALKKALLNI